MASVNSVFQNIDHTSYRCLYTHNDRTRDIVRGKYKPFLEEFPKMGEKIYKDAKASKRMGFW